MSDPGHLEGGFSSVCAVLPWAVGGKCGGEYSLLKIHLCVELEVASF